MASDDPLDTVAYYHVAYQPHRIMNPISEERFSALLARTLPAHGRTALDIGAGKGHAALVLARDFGCHVTLIDSSERWCAEADALFRAAGLRDRAEILCMPAEEFPLRAGSFDCITCLGTSPVYGGYEAALRTLAPGLTSDGILVVGEATIDRPAPRAYARHLAEQGWSVSDPRTVLRAHERTGLDLVAASRSSVQEWDLYMELQWQAITAHALAHPRDEEARTFVEWMRDEQELYLRHQRHVMDWTVFVLRRELV